MSIVHMYSRKREKRRHRFWVRPIFRRGLLYGDGCHLINELRMDNAEHFYNYFRMSPIQFDHLLSLVSSKISKLYVIREPIPVQTRLAITLRQV